MAASLSFDPEKVFRMSFLVATMKTTRSIELSYLLLKMSAKRSGLTLIGFQIKMFDFLSYDPISFYLKLPVSYALSVDVRAFKLRCFHSLNSIQAFLNDIYGGLLLCDRDL